MTLRNLMHDGWTFLGAAIFVFLSDRFLKYWRRRTQARADTWPVTTGQVSETAVSQGEHEARLKMRYYYTLPEQPYPIPAEFWKEFSRRSEAERWADALFGKTIPVRVDPKNPWKSQLWDSELEAIVTATASETPVQ